jgi:hypothetical protein
VPAITHNVANKPRSRFAQRLFLCVSMAASVSCADKQESSARPPDFGAGSQTAPAIDLAREANSKSWRLVQEAVSIGGVTADVCDLLSPVSLIDDSGDPKYGGIFVVIKGDSAIAVGGSDVRVLLQGVAKFVLYAAADSVQVGVNSSAAARKFLKELAVTPPKHLVTYLRYTDGQASKLNFPMAGFGKALAAQKSCGSQPSYGSSSQGTTGKSFSLKNFLKSDVAKAYGVTPGDGWVLSDGSYNNELTVPREPELSFEMSTREDRIISFSFMTVGSRRPDEDQLALMNAVMSYSAKQLGTKSPPLLSVSDFSRHYHQIDEAEVRRSGHLEVRTGSVGPDAVLSVGIGN